MPFLAPHGVRERARQLRDQWMDHLQEAIDDMADELSADARYAIQHIKQAGYNPAAVRRAMDYVLARGDNTMRRYLAAQLKEAGHAADNVDAVYAAWAREGLKPGGVLITAAEAAGVAEGEAVPSVAATALEKVAPLTGRLVRVHEPEKYPKLARDLLPKKQPRISGHLHRYEDQRLIRMKVASAIRESRALEKTARDLIRDAPQLGAGQGLPQGLQRLQEAARRLTELGESPELRKEFRRALTRVAHYAQRIVDPETGTRALKDARGGYAELLQTLRHKGYKATDRALERWLDEKQRYNADRLVSTESAAAYRAREGEQIKRNKDIIAVIWRMSIGARSRYKRRTKPRKSGKLKGSRCICESLAGERFPPSAVSEYPRMGHPNCLCWWDRVYRGSELDTSE